MCVCCVVGECNNQQKTEFPKIPCYKQDLHHLPTLRQVNRHTNKDFLIRTISNSIYKDLWCNNLNNVCLSGTTLQFLLSRHMLLLTSKASKCVCVCVCVYRSLCVVFFVCRCCMGLFWLGAECVCFCVLCLFVGLFYRTKKVRKKNKHVTVEMTSLYIVSWFFKDCIFGFRSVWPNESKICWMNRKVSFILLG